MKKLKTWFRKQVCEWFGCIPVLILSHDSIMWPESDNIKCARCGR